MKKITSTATTLYLVDTRNPSGYAQVLEELTVNGSTTNLSRVYTYGLDLISQRQPNVSTNFFGYDGHGSTRLLLNLGGSVVNAYSSWKANAFANAASGSFVNMNSSVNPLNSGTTYFDKGCSSL